MKRFKSENIQLKHQERFELNVTLTVHSFQMVFF